MSKISDRCKKALTDAQKQELGWIATWTAGREFYRAEEDADAMQAWDKACSASRPKIPPIENDDYLKEFLVDCMLASKDWMPGWNDATCSFSVREFACFAYHAAKLDAEAQKALFDAMQAAGDTGVQGSIPTKWTCPADIASDKAYDISTPSVSKQSASGSSVWWWVLGGAALAVVGAVVYSGQEEKKSHAFKRNPAQGMFKAVWYGKKGQQRHAEFPTKEDAQRYVGPIARRGQAVEIWSPEGKLVHMWYPGISERALNPARGTGVRQQHPEGAEIIDNMARVVWADFWASRREEKGESFGGVDVFDAAPTTPTAAKKWALAQARKLAEMNGLDPSNPYAAVEELYDRAVAANDDVGRRSDPAHRFGSDLGMMIIGSGVSWFDDNTKFDLKVPYSGFWM